MGVYIFNLVGPAENETILPGVSALFYLLTSTESKPD